MHADLSFACLRADAPFQVHPEIIVLLLQELQPLFLFWPVQCGGPMFSDLQVICRVGLLDDSILTPCSQLLLGIFAYRLKHKKATLPLSRVLSIDKMAVEKQAQRVQDINVGIVTLAQRGTNGLSCN